MPSRVMPKNMQINAFKKLFVIWNKPLEKENPIFCAEDQIDLIDWKAYVTEGQTFNENLKDLENNYPEFYWTHVAKERAAKQRNEEAVLAEQVKENTEQHEALYIDEQKQDIPIPEDSSETERIEPPLGEWQIEKNEKFEVHTITIEIQPHRVTSKGKAYDFGRIQLNVPGDFIGLRAKVIVEVPKL